VTRLQSFLTGAILAAGFLAVLGATRLRDTGPEDVPLQVHFTLRERYGDLPTMVHCQPGFWSRRCNVLVCDKARGDVLTLNCPLLGLCSVAGPKDAP
jgi:hypothetical protein